MFVSYSKLSVSLRKYDMPLFPSTNEAVRLPNKGSANCKHYFFDIQNELMLQIDLVLKNNASNIVERNSFNFSCYLLIFKIMQVFNHHMTLLLIYINLLILIIILIITYLSLNACLWKCLQ